MTDENETIRPPCPHHTDTLSLIHQEVSHLRAKLSTANYSAAEAEERARRAERDLTGLRSVHQAIGEALIRVWPSEPRDWVRKVEAVGGELGALRREAQALRDQVRCVGPETCGECLACVRSDLTACRRERDDAQANVDALDEEIVAAVLPSSDQPESLADRCARVVRERDEARALLEVANRGTPPASVVEGLRGLAEREAAPASARELIANLRDDYESVLTLVRAFLDAESDAERAEAVAELRVYALCEEPDEPATPWRGPVPMEPVPLGPTKPEPFIGETPVREWVIGREPPPAREVVAPALALGLTEVGRG